MPGRRRLPAVVHIVLLSLAIGLVCLSAAGDIRIPASPDTGPSALAPSPGAGDVFVDCGRGDDAGGGSATAPVRSLGRATARPLTAGTTLWLARGCAWPGPVVLRGDGTASAPIALAAYGTGPAPVITGASLKAEQGVVQLAGAYQWVVGVHVTGAPGPGVSVAGVYGAVTDTEIDNVGTGVRFAARFGVAERVDVHDLRMVVNTPGGDDDYGAVGFDVRAADVRIGHSRCTNCRAASLDYGHDGGFVEVWNYGDRLSVHDSVGENTNGVLEIGGDAPDASARDVTLRSNRFGSAHGGVWVHVGDRFAIPVANLLLTANILASDSPADPEVLGGDLRQVHLRGNVVATLTRVSTSGAPASHRCNSYRVDGPASVGYPLDRTETVVTPAAGGSPRPAVC